MRRFLLQFARKLCHILWSQQALLPASIVGIVALVQVTKGGFQALKEEFWVTLYAALVLFGVIWTVSAIQAARAVNRDLASEAQKNRSALIVIGIDPAQSPRLSRVRQFTVPAVLIAVMLLVQILAYWITFSSKSAPAIAKEPLPHLSAPSSVPTEIRPESRPSSSRPVNRRVSSSSVKCYLSKSSSSCEIECAVENQVNISARDVAVGFVSFLPTETRIAAPPDFRVKLEKSETLPVPDPANVRVRFIQAFTVHIPVIPPHTKFSFSLWTDDDNNKKACQQGLIIEDKRRAILSDFLGKIREERAAPASEIPDLQVLFSGYAKRSALFQPDTVISEHERRKVEFLTSAELQAMERFQQIYKALKARFIQVFQNRGECGAPVFTVEQTGGTTTTFVSMPGAFTTYVPAYSKSGSPEALPDGKTFRVSMRPAPPVTYECAPRPQLAPSKQE